MSANPQVGKNYMIAEIYSSIEGRLIHLMGKGIMYIVLLHWYLLDMHSYDMSKM